MKIIILVNTNKYRYHKCIVEDIIQGIHNSIPTPTIKTIDMNGTIFLHEIFKIISDYSPQLLINLDYAGFDLLTESGTLSLNLLPMKCANIQFKRKSHYSNELNYRQNFSMYTYIPIDEDIDIYVYQYPNITNFGYFCNITIDQPNPAQQNANIQSISNWIPSMLKDLWLQ